MGSIRDRIKMFEGMNLDDGSPTSSPKPATPKYLPKQPAMEHHTPLVVEGLDDVTDSTVTHDSVSDNSGSERSIVDEASQYQDIPAATPVPVPSSSLSSSTPQPHQPTAESKPSHSHPVLDGGDLYDETAVIKKGETVLYRDRTLGMTEVLIVSVDHALDPPSYVIRINDNERETERNRLFVLKK
mmetsp:Transcript_56750/g.132937  ORF Transcript_56750/g.132937 Transcript_56750/m.132937 type:complete len:185 (+) Transcript_56750:110-664(+)|eukprot:1368035-Rhodomonas_salina.1